MELLTSKILTALALPLGSAALLAAAALAALLIRRTGLAAALLMAGALWVGVWATPAVADWLCGTLEQRFPPVAAASLPQADAIVVLGGGMEVAYPPRLHPDLNAGADRVWHAARLYHAGRAPRVVVSGGGLPWRRAMQSEAQAMQALLERLGVPPEAILREGASSNTRDNARESARLLARHGLGSVLLVTSAQHMPRALASFRAAGVEAVAAATDHEVVEAGPRTLLHYLPSAAALECSSRALKEHLGLLVYRLRGWAA